MKIGIKFIIILLKVLNLLNVLKANESQKCDKEVDKCGVCGGDGSACRRIEGVYDLDKLRSGYNDILLIPAGATNIRIEERVATNNYLAVRNINGEYYLNGNWRIQFPRPYRIGGTVFYYYSKRKPFGIVSPESLRSSGPTTEPLVIVLLYREPNKGLIFEYSVPSDAVSLPQHSIYSWFFGDFSHCSKSCGTGHQTRPVRCVRVMDQYPVSDSLCGLVTRPVDSKECNTDPCAAWNVTNWSECLCDYNVQHRLVYCRSANTGPTNDILTEDECLLLDEPKPPALQKCILQSDCPKWETGEWLKCDSICGTGTQTREVNCTVNGTVVNDSDCQSSNRPNDTQECNENPCDGVEWLTTEWTSCDTQCGSQLQTRKTICADETGTPFPSQACDENRMPETSQLCAELPACPSMWFTSEWSSCSVECGEGLQTRHVFCGHMDDKGGVVVDSDVECSVDRPQNVSVCHLPDCEGIWFSAPYEMCTVPCSGGQRSRKVFCLSSSNEPIFDEKCDSSLKPLTKDDCNTHECDDDQLLAIGGCKDSEFGCCADGVTAAGALYSGCPPINYTNGCNTTEYGCCQYTETASFGPFQRGCHVVCNYTRFGCCPDGITAANSSTYEECPEEVMETTTVTTTEAITTDAMTTTLAPKEFQDLSVAPEECEEGSGEGSGEVCSETASESMKVEICSNSTFGCCPDGMTPAMGDNNEGCVEGSGDAIDVTEGSIDCMNGTCITSITTETIDCNATEFGCCPTGKKVATGPRYYGCTCEDFPNGCCQDRYTPARGPDYDGCICSRMLYGCCNDGVTPATGPNSEGCSCEASPFGCCPDLVSLAKGPNFADCPCDSLSFGCCPGSRTPATGPNFAGCNCANTPFGCCHDGITIAYGPKFEGCPSGPSLDLKLVSEVCGLPKERGSCRNYTVKWYFDVVYGGCNRFWYGGCEGNANRFPSQELCERSCVTPEGPERCALPKVSGPCNGSSVMWYYNVEGRGCEQFIYGGCLGNTNRYETREICEQQCVHQETVLDRCEQPVSVGPCLGNYQRFYYKRDENRCKHFTYGGCKGNQNNFQTEEECHNSCGSQTAQQICSFHKAEGPCLGQYPRWYFDNSYGICREFVYSGCEGNKNRFIDKSACERVCNETRVSRIADNVCALPRAEGPCRAAIINWYFNAETRRCERFYYGGCEGNANRFDDRTACERSCLLVHVDSNACRQTKEPGNCFDYRERWYYDIEDKRCHRFYYSGCNGNENNFNSFEECSQTCGPFTVVSTELSVQHFKSEYCFKSYDSGPCIQNEIRWFYDRSDGVCKEFIYGGCDGNENRFTSRSDCEAKCWNSQDICKLAKVVGSCSGRFTQWYFDSFSNDCQEFLFSGCHGNANRFNNKEMCDNQCKSKTVYTDASTISTSGDVCSQSYESGSCRGYFPRWFYSREDNACKQFIYGGCDGNSNRFESSEECEHRCVTRASKPEEGPNDLDSKEVVCRMEVESGPCTESQAFWFYDPQSHTCLPFVYGGCNGNKNRFKTYELCMRFCSGISPHQPIPAQIPTEVKPVPEMPAECPNSDCDDQRCPFGIDEFVDERGCKACRCSNPCYVYQCPEQMSCAVDVYRSDRGEPRAQPVCRLRNKPGRCPADLSSSNSLSSECVDRCRTDADCRGDDKCCHNGCAHICVLADGIDTTTTPRTVFPYEPYPNIRNKDDSEESEITAIPGNNVTIDCTESTQIAGQAAWSRDGQPLYIVTDRIQLLSNGSVHIINVENDDAGTYACALDNVKTKYTKLIIHAPARILPGPQIVIAQLGLPSFMQCNAIGNPDPRVTWWKGQNMLPLNSIQYRQFSNFTLLIRKVDDKDGGIYTCQAYNGLGPIALWDVMLLLDFDSPDPDIRPYDTSSFNSTHIREQTNYTINGDIQPIESIFTDRRTEPLSARIRTITSEYTIGSTLQLECIVEGQYNAINWYFNSDIPLISDNRRYRILPNNTLIIYNLITTDSGEYKCRASNQHNEAVATVPIRVERVYVPPDCEDSPYFANCDLIVKAKYCNNPHYAKFCCRSCLISGQLDRNQFS